MTGVRQWWKQLGAAGRLIFAGLCFMVAVNVALLVNGNLRSEDFSNPLTDYSKQVVEDKIVNGDPATISGERCNSFSRPISVTYMYTWKTSDSADNIALPGSSGSFTLNPGCSNSSIAYTMPPGVFQYSQEKIKAGEDGVDWYIEALETPIDNEGNLGQIKYWRTNDFTIVAE